MKGLVRSLSQLGANPNPVTHPVNISCGRKSEYPEKSHDFGQSVDQWRTLREILGGGGGARNFQNGISNSLVYQICSKSLLGISNSLFDILL